MRRLSTALLVLLGFGAWASTPAVAAAAAASTGLHVIPFPGTPDASPRSDIIFSSLSASQIISVMVKGSSSGVHTGHLEALPDGAGTAFVPDRHFAAGELVTVTATLSSAAAGTASGDPGATVLDFSFAVAVPALAGAAAAATAGATPSALSAAQSPTSSQGPIQDFVSDPAIHPVVVTAGPDPDQSSGDIFLTPRLTLHASSRFGHHYGDLFQGGPMILNSAGALVWFRPVDGVTANLEVESYRGQPVLTWWQKLSTASAGQDMVVNRSYRKVAVVNAANGYSPDTHEFQITPQGTALIDAHAAVRANLSAAGGPSSGNLSDYVIQELDVRTGQLLWEWHAWGHIPLSATYLDPPQGAKAYDYLHLTSIQQLPNGNLLVSGRHTWGVYEIDKQTGKIIWTLGGKYSSFKLGPGAQFEWQHDAHLTGDTLTLFDDAARPGFQEEAQSSVKEIHLDTAAMTATLVRHYDHYPPILTTSQGSGQTLPNGNMFVGWGASPEFSEYRPDGQQIFNGTFPLGVESYRAYRFPWTGDPVTHPALAIVPGADGGTHVYASWNGATQATAWRVLGAQPAVATGRPGPFRSLGETLDLGFESMFRLAGEPAFLTVQALNAAGQVIGTSSIHPDPPHVDIFAARAFVNSATRSGSVAVGCFTAQPCRFTLQLAAGGSVLSRVTSSRSVPAGRGTLIEFKLSAAAMRALRRGGRLSVQAALRDASGARADRRLELIPYAIGASRLPRRVSQSPHLRIVQTTGFVSSPTGAGGIVAACYASVPCEVRMTLSSGAHVLAEGPPETLGVGDLGLLPFNLTSTARAMLAVAHGNQLPARIVLSAGAARASGSIALVGYR